MKFRSATCWTTLRRRKKWIDRGYDLHALKGSPKRYTVHVNGPWCLTFEFEGTDAYRVDFEQYHQGVEAMTEYKAIRNRDRAPSHPGDAIDDILMDVCVTKTHVADLLGISRQRLHDILSGSKPLSAPIAVKVAALFGGSAESWLRMQATYDAWHASREVDVSGIKRLGAA